MKLWAKLVRTVWNQNWQAIMVNYKVLPHGSVPHVEHQSSTAPFKKFGSSALIACFACHESFYGFPLVSVSLSPSPPALFPLLQDILHTVTSGPELNNNTQNPPHIIWSRVFLDRRTLSFFGFWEASCKTMKALFLAHSSLTQWILNLGLDVMCLMGF